MTASMTRQLNEFLGQIAEFYPGRRVSERTGRGITQTDLQYKIMREPLHYGENPVEIAESFATVDRLFRAFGRPAKFARESAIDSGASGTGSGSLAVATPIQPIALAAPIEDVVRQYEVPQGYSGVTPIVVQSTNQTLLTQATEPTLASTALFNGALTVPTASWGAESQLSKEIERKLPYAMQSFTLSHMTGYNVATINQAMAYLDSISTGSLAAVEYPAGITGESQITSTNIMTWEQLSDGVEDAENNGFADSELVAYLSPKQFRDLQNDSNITRILRYPGQEQIPTAICYLGNLEIRTSTLVPSGANGSGSPATTTYHGYLVARGKSLAMATSQEVIVETFWDLHLNAYVIKSHWNLGFGSLMPNSIVRLTSA
ncbi:MAG: hypothetical protein ACYCPW_03790 [Nitrososphaerales archaeon]